MPGRANLRIVGILITVGCLSLAGYAVDWRQTIEVMARVDRTPVILAFLFLLATLFIFALRWRALLAVEHRPPTRRMFNFLMIGYLANAILPARPGDIIRAVLLRQISGVSLSSGLASIVLERLLDVFAICALGITASFLAALPPLVATGLYSLAAVGLGLFTALVLLSWRRDLIGRFVRHYPILFRHHVARFLAEWLERFASAVSLFNSPARLAASAVLTCLGWSTLAISLTMLVSAFQLTVPPAAALLVLVATNLGAIIPSSPGSLGVYHFMAVMALSVWGVDTSTAVAFAIGSHALAIGLHIILGLAGAWHEGIGMIGLTRIARSDLTITTQGQ